MADNIMAGDIGEDGESSSRELTIARRTRSHLRIDDFVPDDNLNLPDVDMNLYQNSELEVDPEYRTFCFGIYDRNQCYGEEIVNGDDTNTDDNDPEYIYNDDVLAPGWRFDLNEVRELQQDDSAPEQEHEQLQLQQQQQDQHHHHHSTSEQPQHEQNASDCFTNAKSFQIPSNENQLAELCKVVPTEQASSSFKSPSKFAKRKIDMFDDPEFARILNQQLRQHIQLLTQTYLLTKNTKNMRKEAEEAKCHLDSYMKIFKNKSKPSNLLPALELVNNLETPKDLKSSIRLSWRPLPVPDSVKAMLRNNPHVFMYPSLLPQVAYSFLPDKLIPKKPKINFTINEDKLLAYALNEFKGETSPYAFIASLLMTAKTKTQISNHIKNIKRSPCAGEENNPIVSYFNTGKLPEIDLDSDSYIGRVHEPLALKEEEEEAAEEADSIEVVEVKQEEREEKQLVEAIKAEQPEEFKMIKIEPHDGDGEGHAEQKKCEVLPAEEQVQPLVYDQNGLSPAYENYQESEDLMNMNLDDLIAASTTIAKSSMLNNSENNNNKNIKNLKLKKSMLNLMSHNFLLSDELGDLIVNDFLRTSQQKLTERSHIQLLQLLANFVRESKDEDDEKMVHIFQEISTFLYQVQAPPELHEKIFLFLNFNQASKCGCSLSYLHWMRFFEFMQHLELYHEGAEVLEKKLNRLFDALQKEDTHKVKLAIANLVDKHPFLKREYDSLSLEEKPHPSFFICEEDFDDITEPINLFTSSTESCQDKSSLYEFEHFNASITEEELSYASQSCPCKCHSPPTAVASNPIVATVQPPSQHCIKCNLKFMKGRMYLVNKIKPILAEWSYTGKTYTSPPKTSANTTTTTTAEQTAPTSETNPRPVEWTIDDDREILEFCRLKAEQNEETVSFDTSTFEELVAKRKAANIIDGICKKSARDIAERFNHLIEMYNGSSHLT